MENKRKKTFDEILDELDKPVKEKTQQEQIDDNVKEMVEEYSKR